tara:strand:- start:185 stop:529 length:345 start_codon:yes stop_codon:yes gene_type:complete
MFRVFQRCLRLRLRRRPRIQRQKAQPRPRAQPYTLLLYFLYVLIFNCKSDLMQKRCVTFTMLFIAIYFFHSLKKKTARVKKSKIGGIVIVGFVLGFLHLKVGVEAEMGSGALFQ